MSYWRLFGLLRNGVIQPPGKDSSGDYVWLPEDIDRARKALTATRGQKPQEATVNV